MDATFIFLLSFFLIAVVVSENLKHSGYLFTDSLPIKAGLKKQKAFKNIYKWNEIIVSAKCIPYKVHIPVLHLKRKIPNFLFLSLKNTNCS